MPRRRDAQRRARARPPRCRHARDRPLVRSRHLGHRTPGGTHLPDRLQSTACARAEGPMNLSPGKVPLSAWRAIARGEAFSFDPASMSAVAASAAAVAAIVAEGKPVYGINTGFGKLASVRIPPDELGQLQRNIVLSHAAGVGAPMAPVNVRLMMALKLASLARGASGVRPETLAFMQQMLDRAVVPLVPKQGSVGASGDLAPLAHMTAAMLGVGE